MMINLTRWNIMSIKLIKTYAWIIHVEISTVNDTFWIIIENGKVEIQFIIKFLNKIKIKFDDKRIIVQGWIINLINSIITIKCIKDECIVSIGTCINVFYPVWILYQAVIYKSVRITCE